MGEECDGAEGPGTVAGQDSKVLNTAAAVATNVNRCKYMLPAVTSEKLQWKSSKKSDKLKDSKLSHIT